MLTQGSCIFEIISFKSEGIGLLPSPDDLKEISQKGSHAKVISKTCLVKYEIY